MKRVILTTGGTGGHIFPALAVARELKDMYPGIEILFVGGSGPEERLAREAGLQFESLPAKGVLGRGFKAAGVIFWMTKSIYKSWKLLRSFKPDAVLGFGGYAGFCPVLVATWRNIPTAIHEQNSLPGTANRVLGHKVNRVFASFEDATACFECGKVTLTGNPVRREMAEIGGKDIPERADGPMRMLILGGSQGSRAINNAVTADLETFKKNNIVIWHQTGKADFSTVESAYMDAGYDDARVDAFIENMGEAYAWADFVVCRAGATTIAELAVVGKPSILIPFPYATHDHQSLNARYLAERHAGVLLNESALPNVGLAQFVLELANNPDELREMGKRAREIGRPDAAARVAAELGRLASGNGEVPGENA